MKMCKDAVFYTSLVVSVSTSRCNKQQIILCSNSRYDIDLHTGKPVCTHLRNFALKLPRLQLRKIYLNIKSISTWKEKCKQVSFTNLTTSANGAVKLYFHFLFILDNM